MVLSDAEKAARAQAEKEALARKKEERDRILRDQAADRDYYKARTAAAPAAEEEKRPKVFVNLRYDTNGKQGRKRLELDGYPETISYFLLLQAIEEQFKIAPSLQVLRPANKETFPVVPQDKALPPFNAFASVDDFPSLQVLGVTNGQELFLTVGVDAGAAAAAAAAAASAAASSAAEPAAPTPAPPPSPLPPSVPDFAVEPRPAPAPRPPPAAAQASGGARAAAPLLSDEHRLKFLWRTIEQQKLNLVRARDARIAAEIERVRADPETGRLAGLLLWSRAEVDFFCQLKADLHRTVGLEPVREFIVQRLRDAAGRHVLKEGKFSRRHVIISGSFGVGKRVAAELIGRLFGLVGGLMAATVRVGSRVRMAAWQDAENRGALISKNDLGIVTEEFPAGTNKPFRVQGPSGRFGNYREDELVAEPELLISLSSLSELVDPKTGKLRVADRSCYYLRLAAALSEAESQILEGVLEAESVVILSGNPEVVDANLQLSAFRRRQPHLLALPTLTYTDIAQLIAMKVEDQGYQGVGEGDVGTAQLVTVLEHIVRQRFDEQLVREKNGHLARDVLDLAITRKNDRTWAESLDSKERFRLTPMDFGLDVLTAEQRDRRLQEVEEEVASLIGWGSADEPGTPRYFFTTLRRQVAGKAGDRRGAPAAAVLHLPRALWVTANTGSGRETFVRLACRFLRACGAISREETVWVDGAELAAATNPSELLETKLAAANRGCIVVRDAEALVDAREALRALAAALGASEGSGGTTLSMIFGTPSGMARICRMEPALEARFPTRLALPDFTAAELVDFIEKAASDLPSGALLLDQGLSPRLVEHINETYGGGVQGKELGERGNLALARRLLQRAVQNRITRLFNRIQDRGDGHSEAGEAEVLTLGDFEVGAPLGEGTDQKAAIDEEVHNLVGMGKAKDWFQQVRQKVAFVEKTGTRSDLRVCLNIIITGNPGTGKTTFARLLAKFFHTYGVLSKDSFVEKNGLELKAEYMGGTAPRVKAAVQEAMGGCLFLDEAYALMDSSAGIGGGGDAFSQEALRTLLTEVENHRTNLMVVLAGYKEKMGRLLRAEEGLSRRFPGRLALDDYTPDELAAICEMTSRTKHQRDFEPGLREKLARHIENFYWRDIAQQNAGLAVNLTERALDRQIVRIVSEHPQAFQVGPGGAAGAGSGPPSATRLQRQISAGDIHQVKEKVAFFTAADFGIEERPTLGDPELRAKVQAEVQRLTGMTIVKGFFSEMSRTVAFVERGGDPRVLQTCLNLRLTGNPGTGKTTVARLIGRYLYAHGVLPRDTFVERNALALKGQFVGQTAPTVMEAVRDAMGGCLFIDEAYALADRGGDKFSGEVIRTLLTEVENHRTGLLVVLAGYADKMNVLMDSDPGLRRRFATELTLQDYTPEELAQICEFAAADRLRLTFAPGLREKLARHISERHGDEIHQHNGGLAVTLAERAFRRLATRLGDPEAGDVPITGPAARELLPEDFEIAVGCCSHGGSSGSRAAATAKAKSIREDSQEIRRGIHPHKRPRGGGPAALRDTIGNLARGIAAELLRSMEEAVQDGGPSGDEDMPSGDAGGAGPSREGRSGAIAKARAKALERTKERPAEVAEEALPMREGERVIEEISTLEALDQLGLCPANFEWFEISVADPPDESCGICGYKLADGYRCGGGTHFVCMGCISEYKTKR